MNDNIITYKDSNQKVMARLIKSEYKGSGIEFLTNDNDYMQVAYMGHPKGHIIQPHYHNKIIREIDYTCETLVIRKGRLEVSLYENQEIIYLFEIKTGDILTLYSGGHGFKVLEELEMVEIKQGPYIGIDDKTRF